MATTEDGYILASPAVGAKHPPMIYPLLAKCVPHAARMIESPHYSLIVHDYLGGGASTRMMTTYIPV
jgi:hypothetical protein